MESRASPTASSNSASDRCMGRVCHAGPNGLEGWPWPAAARTTAASSVAVVPAGRRRGLGHGVGPGGLRAAVADAHDLHGRPEGRHEADDRAGDEEQRGTSEVRAGVSSVGSAAESLGATVGTARRSPRATTKSRTAAAASPMTQGSKPSASCECVSMRSLCSTCRSRYSPDSVDRGVSTTARTDSASGIQAAHRRKRGHTAQSSTVTAAAGTTTVVAWTMRGWTGRPKIVSSMEPACRWGTGVRPCPDALDDISQSSHNRHLGSRCVAGRREGPPAPGDPSRVAVAGGDQASAVLLVGLDRLALLAGPCGLDGLVSALGRGRVVLVLVVGRLELGRGGRGDAVAEVEVRELRPEALLAGDGAVDAVGVLARCELERLVGLVLDQGPALVGGERSVDLP